MLGLDRFNFFGLLLVERVPFPKYAIGIALNFGVSVSHFKSLFSPTAVFVIDFNTAIMSFEFFGYHTYGTYGMPMFKETVWFEMRALPGQQLLPQSEEDIAQAVWVPMAEVDAKLRNSYESVRDLWETAKTSR